MMGCGKSTVGRNLADWLGTHFEDTDARIEFEQGISTPEMFERLGEAHFRTLERQALQDALATPPCVISTGGGLFADPENRQRLQNQAVVIYLKATPEHLYERVRHARGRPLLQTEDPLSTLRDLLESRTPSYEQASYTVDVENLDASRVTQYILSLPIFSKSL